MKIRTTFHLLAALIVFLTMSASGGSASLAAPETPPGEAASTLTSTADRASGPGASIHGPFVSEPVAPAVFEGDLRNLPQLDTGLDVPLREVPRPGSPPGKLPPEPSGAVDPVAQTWQGVGQMPLPIMNFDGLEKNDAGGWTPPDTNGDVGPAHYVQTVNVGIGMYDKATGAELVNISFNDLFNGTGTSCDTQNRGDPISLYDPMADRWIITDFSLPSGGPFLECIAVSMTGDPVSGGWYFYALDAGNIYGSWHDYPKLGIWPDGYYMSANMFDPAWGAKVWALDREAMLDGLPMSSVSFDLGSDYWSLLPSNLRGPQPPDGSPNYFVNLGLPGVFRLWEFHVDWNVPGNSTFTGPIELPVADFEVIFDIPQPSPGWLVDSLSYRPMMQLQYRNFDTHESLWVNHTVASGEVSGVRWYEVRDPGGVPYVNQQGTYQPDDYYRWMGSLAVDQDGNMAVGYSVSSEGLMPAIRYAGRLFGEAPGTLPQAETSLIEGTGVQTGSDRWGDYSAMSVDPVDDCTFWYTQEYFEFTGSLWKTRIGSFRFPSCGEPKGWISGTVYNAATLEPVAGAPVVAEGVTTTLTAETDAYGVYHMALPAGTYDLTAGPLLPGYPDPATVPGVGVTIGETTIQDLHLSPVPYLVEDDVWIDDFVVGGNNNGYPEPGETGILLWESLLNIGATTATNVIAQLAALTPGVTVDVDYATYPDIEAGELMTNLTPFEFSIDGSVPCGETLDFEKVVTTDQGIYVTTFSLDAKVPLPVVSLFADDMESGDGNWTSDGNNNQWAITDEQAHSPIYAWSDSPGGNYPDYGDSWIQSPTFDLTGNTGVSLSFWHTYALESGWDFGYVEVSLDGGSTWEPPLDSYTAQQESWVEETLEIPALDDQPNAAFRFRIETDTNTNEDGWYIDDVDLFYEPFACYPPLIETGVPTLLSPPDGTVTGTPEVTFTWEPDEGAGKPVGYNLELDGEVFTTTESIYATVLDAGEHAWRVRAYNDLGYSDYTAAWGLEVIELPDAPSLLAPPDGTITATQDITFTWEAGAGGEPDGYNVEVDGEVFTTTEPIYATMLDVGEHSWRVRAYNIAGYSGYTEAWDLAIIEAPGTPTLLAPADGTITTTNDITITWEAGTGGVPDGYNLELDGEVVTTTAPIYTTTLDVGEHTWRVRAYNFAGTSDYSDAWTLSVEEPIRYIYLPIVARND